MARVAARHSGGRLQPVGWQAAGLALLFIARPAAVAQGQPATSFYFQLSGGLWSVFSC